MTDYSEPFEVAYKWILAPPKRDVRALCSTQSTGSTKQRQKKQKKTNTPADGTAPASAAGNELTSVPSQNVPPPADAPTNTSYAPIPPVWLPSLPQASAAWSRNPALAQYYQYVWQTEQQKPKSKASEDSFNSIMQRMQAVPAQPTQQVQPRAPQTNLLPIYRPEIVLPPPQFNMGQPPQSLLPAVHQANAPIPQPAPNHIHPAAQLLQLQPNPPPSHPLHIPPYKPRPAINIQQNPWSAQGHNTPQSHPSNTLAPISITPQTQYQPQELRQMYPRPLAPSPPTQAPVPQMSPYDGFPVQWSDQGQI